MINAAELDLENNKPRFIAVGNQTFLNSKGKTETCRKGLRGEHCQRHHGGSITSFQEARAKLDAHAERTAQKLSTFENGCIWLYSVLMRIPIEEARTRYINNTAMYTLLGVTTPTSKEVNLLQKILLKLADLTHNTSTRMEKLRRLIKKMTVGNGFSEAGFYSLKDMVNDASTRLKLGVAGTMLGGTLFLTGCSGGSPTGITDSNSSEIIGEETLIDKSFGDSKSLVKFETIEDQYGKYTRTYLDGSKIKIINESNLSDKEAKDVVNLAVKFATLEVMDSIALDDGSRWEEWKTNVAPQYLHTNYIDSMLTSSEEGYNIRDIVLNNGTSAHMPTLLRDGGVRVADKRIGDITIKELEGGIIDVSFNGSARFYAIDSSVGVWENKDAIANVKENTDASPEEIAALEAMVNDVSSKFKDGKDNVRNATFALAYTMLKDNGGWKIAGYSSGIELKSFDNVTAEQNAYRDNVK